MVLTHNGRHFDTFWKDKSAHLIQHRDLIRMKVEKVDEDALTKAYVANYLTLENLKDHYKNFLDALLDEDFRDGNDMFAIMYLADKDFFRNSAAPEPRYLVSYGFQ